MARATRSKQQANGDTHSQANGTDGRPSKRAKTSMTVASLDGEEHHKEFLASFRCLVADLCQQFGGGHPG